MGPLITACRLVLLAVFGLAATAKVSDRSGGADAAVALGVPHRLSGAVSVLLPLTELGIVAALLFGPTTVPGAAAALVLLVAFTALVSRSLRAGRRPSCHCFGQLGDAPIGPATLVRNLGLMVPALILLLGAGSAPSALHRAVGEELARAGLTPALGLLALGLVGQLGVIVMLLGRQGRLEARLAAIEGDPALVGLPVGSMAPTFTLQDLDDRAVSLDGLRSIGRPVLIVFTDPACKPCNALLPELADWQATYNDVVSVAVLSTGAREENRAKAATYGLASVLLQEGTEVANAYRYQGTPGAVLVAPDGRIAQTLATGGAAIRQMAGSVIQEARAGGAPAVAHLAIGDPVPALRLPGLDGTPVDLFDLSGRLVAIVFFSPTCTHCQAMLPDLHAREVDIERAGVRLLIVSSGPVQSVRALGLHSTQVIDHDLLTSRAFGVNGTPMALLVDAQGRAASSLAAGAEEVLPLLDRAARLAIATESMLRMEKTPIPLTSDAGRRAGA